MSCGGFLGDHEVLRIGAGSMARRRQRSGGSEQSSPSPGANSEAGLACDNKHQTPASALTVGAADFGNQARGEIFVGGAGVFGVEDQTLVARGPGPAQAPYFNGEGDALAPALQQ